MNATVSGLFSRTIRNSDILDLDDFDGAVFYEELREADKSNEFLDTITNYLKGITDNRNRKQEELSVTGMSVIMQIAQEFGVKDINKIKPRNW